MSTITVAISVIVKVSLATLEINIAKTKCISHYIELFSDILNILSFKVIALFHDFNIDNHQFNYS